MTLFILLQLVMADGAGFYAETRIDALIKEPWNAFSSLSFWLPVFYWSYKLRGQYRQHAFLTACMPLLFIGGLGSALFHAFRSSRWLLLLDVLPILVLFLLITLYFWRKVLPNMWALWGVIAVYIAGQAFISNYFQPSISINVSYFWRGVGFFLPALLLLRRINYQGTRLLLAALLWFVLALVYRSIDRQGFTLQIFSMGSHWLWHLSTAVGAFYLAEFLYRLPAWEKKAM